MLCQLLGVLFLCTLGFATTIYDCPSTVPKDSYLQVYDDKCYYFQLKKYLDFPDAQKYCQKRGGSLALDKTEVIDNFLIGHLKRTYSFSGNAWIGLHDEAIEDVFEWVDGTPLSYSNFASGEGTKYSSFSLLHNHNFEDCVTIDAGSGLWRDFRCQSSLFGLINEKKHFICQFQAKKTTTSPATLLTSTV